MTRSSQKKTRPSAHIACLDAVDVCVLSNLIICFKSMGFAVTWSKRIQRCDLLIIKRGTISEAELARILPIPTIILSYVGTPTKLTEQAILHKSDRVLVIATSDQLASRECESIVANLPVAVSLWARDPTRVRYPVSYVGNRKNLHTDGPSKELNSWVGRGGIDVWGRWWKGKCPESRRHPPLTVFSVSDVFRRSGITKGLMYPFQRELGAYSSRYWLAPLAGCQVSVECANHKNMPGILVDQSVTGGLSVRTLAERQCLAREAQSFWEKDTASLQRKVAEWWGNQTGQSVQIVPMRAVTNLAFDSVVLTIMRLCSVAERLGLKYGVDVSPFNTLRFWR